MAKILPSLGELKTMEEEPKPSMTMDRVLQDLVNEMFAFYAKLHKYHWNVVGQNFFDLHKMFGAMYEDVWENIDKTAEYIRILGVMADIRPPASVGSASTDMQMVDDVLRANESMLVMLKSAEEAADYYEHCDIENFMADRIDQHNKWDWQLKSFKGVTR